MKKPIAAIVLILHLAACSSFVKSTPTAIPTSTFTAVPTLAPTNTSHQLTETPDAVEALLPEGQPASEWNGIPIMPNAIAGEGDAESYIFTVKATPQQVQDFYQTELRKLGWQSFAQGNGNSSLMLIFMDDASTTLTVSIIMKGDEALVLLVK